LPVAQTSELKDLQSNTIKGVAHGLLITKHGTISSSGSISSRIERPDQHVVLIEFAAIIVTLTGILENSNRAKWIRLVGGKEYGRKRQETSRSRRVLFKAKNI
jgi:hypothetical protein